MRFLQYKNAAQKKAIDIYKVYKNSKYIFSLYINVQYYS